MKIVDKYVKTLTIAIKYRIMNFCCRTTFYSCGTRTKKGM